MKKTVIALILVITAGLLAACGGSKSAEQTEETTTMPDESLYGTWKEDYFDSGFIFNSDCTGEDTFWDLPFTYVTEEGGQLTITFDDEIWGVTKYTYSVSGNTLKMQQEDSSDTYEYTKQ